MPENEQISLVTPVEGGAYHKVAVLVKEFIDINRDERFDLDTICRQLQISERANRKYVSIELARKVNQGKLEKLASGAHSYYKYVNYNKRIIKWNEAETNNIVPIRWPCSHLDCSEFGFSQSLVVSQGDLIVVAGVSNMGKTTFAQNFLFENMDAFDCQMMVNEYNPGKFKRRVQKMTWGNPFKENGDPKFTLVERHEDWKYAIEPDQLNIIDWINISDGDFYKIGGIMEGIQGKLRKGIALIVLQKNEAKDLGTGGQFSEHLAAIYFNIDKNRLSVRKIKEYNGPNPNGKIWGFDIDGGTDFHFIRELKPCPKCHSRCLVNKIECVDCHSTGYVDRELANSMTEAQLQSAIIELAHALGYRAAHFRPALTSKGWRTPVSADGKGFPDLNLVKKGRVIYIECKSENGKQSPEQLEWELAIRTSGAEYFLFRPSDWVNENVERALGS